MQFSFQRLPSRAIWLKIHIYIALSAGFFFALMGLTGSISVYREELDTLLNPQLIIEQPSGKRQSLDKIIASVQAAHPNRHGSWTLEMPRSPNGMITAWFDKPQETYFELYAPLMVSINPYSAEVVASRFWGQTLTTWLLDLHTQLHFERFGWNAVGILSLLLMLSIGSGIFLWWPGWHGIRGALVIHHNLGMIRLVFDLHRLIGLLTAPILLLLAFTGFNLSYPAVLEKLVGSSGMEHGETGRTIISTATPNNHPVGLESAEFVARGPFPRAELRRVTTPAGDSGIYRINLRQSSEINQRHPYTTVWVDRWSGQIREVRNPSSFNRGESFTSWIWPMHTGEAVGGKGRLLWFFSGIGLFFLYVTGLLRWLHRHGKVKDREISFAGLKPLFWRLLVSSYHLMLILVQLTVNVLRGGKSRLPEMMRACESLLQRLYAMIKDQQKKLDNNRK